MTEYSGLNTHENRETALKKFIHSSDKSRKIYEAKSSVILAVFKNLLIEPEAFFSENS